MDSGSVALVLVQPASLTSALSTTQLMRWLAAAMLHRQEDVYFRPLLEAPTLGALSWRAAKLRWRFAVESRGFAIGLIFLWLRHPGERPSPQILEDAYAEVQSRLAASPFSEETVANIDYAVYTGLRANLAMMARPPLPTELPSPARLAALADAATRFELYTAAGVLAAAEPSLVKNPLVLKEIAGSAVKAADAYVAGLAELGLPTV